MELFGEKCDWMCLIIICSVCRNERSLEFDERDVNSWTKVMSFFMIKINHSSIMVMKSCYTAPVKYIILEVLGSGYFIGLHLRSAVTS